MFENREKYQVVYFLNEQSEYMLSDVYISVFLMFIFHLWTHQYLSISSYRYRDIFAVFYLSAVSGISKKFLGCPNGPYFRSNLGKNGLSIIIELLIDSVKLRSIYLISKESMFSYSLTYPLILSHLFLYSNRYSLVLFNLLMVCCKFSSQFCPRTMSSSAFNL